MAATTGRWRVRGARWRRGGAVGGLALLLGACTNLAQPIFPPIVQQQNPPQRSAPLDNLAGDPSAFAQITDIPIPANARLNVSRSIILGGQDMWTGRAEIETPYTAAEMYDFFRREMVTFGWTELTSVRSDESVITFLRAQRIATVQIFGAGQGVVGSVISLTVAPVGSNGVIVQPAGATTGTAAPAPSAANLVPQNAPTGSVQAAPPRPVSRP